MSDKLTKARVIAGHGEHKVNDIVSLDADALKAAVAAGEVDAHPSAVAYAEALAKED
jgi:hypothetical protein